jgi:phage terminase large subunit-like protein
VDDALIEAIEECMSNTAVPTYYGYFREAVERGDMPVNEFISMEMNRIDDMIDDPDIYYAPNVVEGFIEFCEAEMTLNDGGDLSLLPIFKVWAEQLLGWYHYVEEEDYDEELGRWIMRRELRRRINKQYLIVARGAAKSMYASLLQSYFLNVDTTTTHQICTAPTMKQAEEVMGPFRTAITRARGPYFKFLTAGSINNTSGDRWLRPKLAATKMGIQNFLTNSLLEVRPMSIDKLQGLGTKVNTVDEWLSGDVREDVIGALEQGASKVKDWVVVAISSEGVVRNGAGDTIKLELLDILRGDYIRPDTSIWYYRLDRIEEVEEGLDNPSVWLKANPNIGKTVSWETYRLDVEKAKKVPAAKNDIFAKRFGIPMEGHVYFFTYEETLLHRHVRPNAYHGAACSLGIDLSQGDDFCAFTFLFPMRNGKFGVDTRSYITKRTLDMLPGALRQKYQEFLDEGSLVVMEGNVLDIDGEVFDDIDAYIHHKDYQVTTVGYDTYNAKAFMEKWVQLNGEWGVEKVIQGARTESVPLGEIKILTEDRLLVFHQELMKFTMGNAITIEDTNGNRKLSKKRKDEKIDNVAALMDAYVAYRLHKEEF